jgi:HAD superfamily hydrolase (TIGR01509 family)
MRTQGKLVIFDLDGVLLDSRDLHFESFNLALDVVSPSHNISRSDHLKLFDGLNTRRKLEILSERYELDRSLHDKIWTLKQEFTSSLLENIEPDLELQKMLILIKKHGLAIAVASNSIRDTVQKVLVKLDIGSLVDFVVANEDVKFSKPFPEAYWKCMIQFGALPSETVIFEDSEIGRRGALSSGAILHTLRNRQDLTFGRIEKAIRELTKGSAEMETSRWKSDALNILIPMAGAGSRFADAGFTFPKPLIEVLGKPMIQSVVDNLNIEAQYIFIVQKKDHEKYNLEYLLNLIAPGCKIVVTEGLTEGAACTTLLAADFIDNDQPLLIANSDQLIEWDSSETMYALETSSVDGSILVFNSSHPKWSYAKVNSDGFVTEVAEKKPISNLATVGIYYWKKGSDYVKYAKQMIKENQRVNGEFYVCPVYNLAIQDAKSISTRHVDRMWGIGTPEDLDIYLRSV